MRKATHYKVSGVLETKPTDLPEGLEVEKVEVLLPARQFKVNPIHNFGGVFINEYFFERTSSFGSVGVQWPDVGIIGESEVRKLRDFLNEILEEQVPTLRAFRDVDGDAWFELQPNVFTMGNRCSNGYQAARLRAEERIRAFEETGYPDGFRERSLEYISETYGPLTEFKP